MTNTLVHEIVTRISGRDKPAVQKRCNNKTILYGRIFFSFVIIIFIFSQCASLTTIFTSIQNNDTSTDTDGIIYRHNIVIVVHSSIAIIIFGRRNAGTVIKPHGISFLSFSSDIYRLYAYNIIYNMVLLLTIINALFVW